MFDPFHKRIAHCVNQLFVVLLKESCNQAVVRQAHSFHTEPITALLTHYTVDRFIHITTTFHRFARAHVTNKQPWIWENDMWFGSHNVCVCVPVCVRIVISLSQPHRRCLMSGGHYCARLMSLCRRPLATLSSSCPPSYPQNSMTKASSKTLLCNLVMK